MTKATNIMPSVRTIAIKVSHYLSFPMRYCSQKYSDRFNANMTLDQKVDALYDLAVEKYKDNAAANIFGLNEVDPDDSEGRTYKEKYWNKRILDQPLQPVEYVPVLSYSGPSVCKYG